MTSPDPAETRRSPRRQRLGGLWAVLVLAAVALLATACGGGGDSSSTTTASTDAAGGPGVPQVKVKNLWFPAADNSFNIIGSQKGWFDEVGIEIEPAPLGKSTEDFEAITTQLLNNQVDLSSYFAPNLIPTLPEDTGIRMVALTDIYLGYSILASPEMEAKSVGEFMEEGLDFEAAITKTLEQTEGKTLYTSTEPTARPFMKLAYSQAGMTFEDTVDVKTITSEKMLQIANSGSADLVSPTLGTQVVQLEKQGWKSLVMPVDLLENVEAKPGTQLASELAGLVANPGVASTEKFIEGNWDTVLRYVSVYFRILDYIEEDLEGAAEAQLPALNATGGTELTAAELGKLYSTIDPIVPWDEQGKFFTDPKSPYNWEKVYTERIKTAEAEGVLPKGGDYSPEQISVADKVYADLKGYEEKAEGLLSEAEGPLAEQAQAYFDAFDFLDAYRYAKAATEA